MVTAGRLSYHRYRIEIRPAPDLVRLPPRFRVEVKKHRLIGLVLEELVRYRADLPVVLSRPCVYGVFSRPVGRLAPKEELCVGCLRCTVQYPDVVQIYPNPERERLGDSYLKPAYVDTLLYEARTGHVPVRGAGYRGPLGGAGWDGMWTDMSEIVRPTRDGIHGREFISTAIDIGEKPPWLVFNEDGEPVGALPRLLTIQVPFLFDCPPQSARPRLLLEILARAAQEIETLALVPLDLVVQFDLAGPHVVSVVEEETWRWLARLSWSPRMIALTGWEPGRVAELDRRSPGSTLCTRVDLLVYRKPGDSAEPAKAVGSGQAR